MIVTCKMQDFYLIDDYLCDSTLTENLLKYWHHKIPYQQLSLLLEQSWYAAPNETLMTLFKLRKEKGDRRQFYQGIRWFVENHPEQIIPKLYLIPQVGYWKDLLNIWDHDVGACGGGTPQTTRVLLKSREPRNNELLRASIIYVYCQQLKQDLYNYNNGDNISLAAKWAPTEKTAIDRKWGLVELFCQQLNWSRKQYRQNISALRNVLEVTERLACDHRWGEIDFDRVPTKARNIFHNTLQKHCGARYQRWCNQNTI